MSCLLVWLLNSYPQELSLPEPKSSHCSGVVPGTPTRTVLADTQITPLMKSARLPIGSA